ncbi:transcriptional regulator [Saccharibacillus sp. O23]|uniref:helix-turn-helix transcriptional regulator n=1 Tax=Saccharibacillus sp. O23 TaxID=2009338 RepID=UPI000B4E0FF9|nr:helix-turn-helix transcriptional regulator [Saccharibacillus sp. O23]OWR30824.1 transcriptional regulator [Saccharibacillus sp. O23]
MKNRIKENRERLGLSQGKLAELCGVSRQTINAIENDKYDPSLQLAFDLARTLELTLEQCFVPKSGHGSRSAEKGNPERSRVRSDDDSSFGG